MENIGREKKMCTKLFQYAAVIQLKRRDERGTSRYLLELFLVMRVMKSPDILLMPSDIDGKAMFLHTLYKI